VPPCMCVWYVCKKCAHAWRVQRVRAWKEQRVRARRVRVRETRYSACASVVLDMGPAAVLHAPFAMEAAVGDKRRLAGLENNYTAYNYT
jgi:hypothetical protein